MNQLAQFAERSARLRSGILTSILSRTVSAITPLLVVPMALRSLGADGYGAWSAALSLTTLVIFADLGIGTGLMTRLGQRQDDPALREECRSLISTSYVLMIQVVIVCLAALGILASILDWSSLLGVNSRQSSSTESIVTITLAAFVINMFTSLVVRVQYGLGQQATSNMWQMGSSASTLVAVWIATQLAMDHAWFIALASFTPVIVMLGNTTWFFTWSITGRPLSPRASNVDPTLFAPLLSTGLKFLSISVLSAAVTALDPWIVSNTAALDTVPNFTIPHRLFLFASSIAVMLTLPLWPFHARAVSNGETAWIQSATKKMTMISTITSVSICLILVFVGPTLLHYWLDDSIPYDRNLWIGLASWVIVQALTGAAFMAQNGAEVLAPQAIAYAALLATLPIKWVASSTVGYWAIPYISSTAYILLVLPACWIGYRTALNKSRKSIL